MKQVIVKDLYRHKETSLTNFVENNLSGSDCDRGKIEGLQKTVDNLMDAFSNLSQIMFTKGVLTKDDVLDCLNYCSYEKSDIEFTIEEE